MRWPRGKDRPWQPAPHACACDCSCRRPAKLAARGATIRAGRDDHANGAGRVGYVGHASCSIAREHLASFIAAVKETGRRARNVSSGVTDERKERGGEGGERREENAERMQAAGDVEPCDDSKKRRARATHGRGRKDGARAALGHERMGAGEREDACGAWAGRKRRDGGNIRGSQSVASRQRSARRRGGGARAQGLGVVEKSRGIREMAGPTVGARGDPERTISAANQRGRRW